MKKIAPITKLIDFDIKYEYILSKNKKIYFLRFMPPNTSIMTNEDFESEVLNLQRLIDSLNIPFQIFATDKTEDFSENKKYYQSLNKKYYHLTSDIIQSIESIEVSSISVQRAYYLIFKLNENEDISKIYNIIVSKGFSIYIAQKKEITLLMRNYILREFTSFDIDYLDFELKESYEKLKKKKGEYDDYFKSELVKRLSPNRMSFRLTETMQNNLFRRTIMIKNIPSKNELGYIKDISQIRNTTFSMHISPMPKSLVTKLTNVQMNNKKSIRNNLTTEKIESEQDQNDITEFYKQIARNKNGVYYVNIFIEFYGKSIESLNNKLKDIDSTLQGLGITYEVLVEEQKEGFLSVYPIGQDNYIISANNIPSNTLASMYPFSYSSRNDVFGMILGESLDGGNMIVDFNNRDSNITNGNYTIAGTSGQGKTYLQKKILSQSIIQGDSCFVLDPEDEYCDMFRNLGGTVINCADGRVKINPFEVRTLKNEDDLDDKNEIYESEGFKKEKVFFQHLSWLKDFFTVLFPNIQDKELQALMIIIKDIYDRHNINEKSDFNSIHSNDYPTFTNVYEYILNQVENNLNDHIMITQDILKSLLLMLKDCYDGALGFLFNGHTNIENKDIICFSLLDLLTGSKDRTQAVLFNIMTYVWNRISKKEKRVLFAVDELYLLMNKNNMVIATYLRDFTKRSRKYEAKIGTATQNLGDFLDPEMKHISMGIFNNTAFKFIFYPEKVDLSVAKDMLKLSDGETKKISTSNKKHCLLKAGKDVYYMKVGTLPFESFLFGTASGR